MPINILMPALSPTMEKGNLAKWLKKEGDKVKSGDVIAEIETDKATMEVEAVDEGTIAKILVPEGTQDVPVNDVIAVLAGDGEDVKSAGAAAAKPAAKPAEAPAPKACRRDGCGTCSCCGSPGSEARRSAGAGCRSSCAASQRPRPHLFFAAGATPGQGSRYRNRTHRRFRAARPYHRP
jgi:pyruvate dehydrogenase E2 component (dihydrolipoamide acetyltransferase)